MHGPIQRMIQSQGVEYDVHNTDGGDGDRQTPSYEPDGTLVGVLERRSRPTAETLSSGEEVAVDLEVRSIPDDTTTIVGAGESDWPTRLKHPDGQTYEVVASYPEDSGVTVLTVVQD